MHLITLGLYRESKDIYDLWVVLMSSNAHFVVLSGQSPDHAHWELYQHLKLQNDQLNFYFLPLG